METAATETKEEGRGEVGEVRQGGAKEVTPLSWVQCASPQGQAYWYNATTDESSWSNPTAAGVHLAATASATGARGEAAAATGVPAIAAEAVGAAAAAGTTGATAATTIIATDGSLWDELWSNEYQQSYFVSPTGETTWVLPTTVVGAAAMDEAAADAVGAVKGTAVGEEGKVMFMKAISAEY